MSQTIFHVEKNRDYSVISNAMVRDIRLSFAARGLLTYLLTLKPDWSINTAHLIKQSPLGRDGLLRLLRELERFGHLYRAQSRLERGLRGPTVINIYESPELNQHFSPQTAFPSTEEPFTDSPSTAKPLLLKTNKEVNTKKKETLNTQGADAPGESLDLLEALNLYKDLFFERFGVFPVVGSGKDRANLTRLLKSHGKAVVEKCMRAYFESDSDFIINSVRFSLACFYSANQFTNLIAEVSERENESKRIRSDAEGVEGYGDILADIKSGRKRKLETIRV